MARPRKSIKITELIEIVNELNKERLYHSGTIIISPEKRAGWNTLLRAALQLTNSDAGYQLTNPRDRSRIQFHIHPALIEKVEETTDDN